MSWKTFDQLTHTCPSLLSPPFFLPSSLPFWGSHMSLRAEHIRLWGGAYMVECVCAQVCVKWGKTRKGCIVWKIFQIILIFSPPHPTFCPHSSPSRTLCVKLKTGLFLRELANNQSTELANDKAGRKCWTTALHFLGYFAMLFHFDSGIKSIKLWIFHLGTPQITISFIIEQKDKILPPVFDE